MGHIVYAQRNGTAAAYDTATIDLLEWQGHTVQVETGTLASIDWSAVDLLIIGAPGNNITEHTNGAALNGYDVDIVSMCNYTSRVSLGIGAGAVAQAISTFTRLVDEDPRAIFASVSTTGAWGISLSSLDGATTLIYRNNVSSAAAGIAEKFRDSYSRIHWGYYSMNSASSDMEALFIAFMPPSETMVAIESTEQADTAAFQAKHMPPGGYTVETATTESADLALFEATVPYAVRFEAVEGNDAAAFLLDHRWDDLAEGLQVIYRCYLEAEGFAPLEVPISSWQATLQTGRSSYVQAVVPAASALYAGIVARAAGEFVVYRGVRFESGIENLREMARAPIGVPVLNQGPQRTTVTLSGYTTAYTDLPAGEARTLTAIRSLSITSTMRVRCAIDWRLRPGSVATAGSSSFTVAYINYYVGGTDSYMDVGERAL